MNLAEHGITWDEDGAPVGFQVGRAAALSDWQVRKEIEDPEFRSLEKRLAYNKAKRKWRGGLPVEIRTLENARIAALRRGNPKYNARVSARRAKKRQDKPAKQKSVKPSRYSKLTTEQKARIREQQTAWRKANPAKMAALRKAWNEANPEKVKAQRIRAERLRRVKRADSSKASRAVMRAAKLAATVHRCHWCGFEWTPHVTEKVFKNRKWCSAKCRGRAERAAKKLAAKLEG